MDSSLDFSVLALAAATTICLAVAFLIGRWLLSGRKRRRSAPPPSVPGLPLIGNLLQLNSKKPYHTFAKWAEIYGPIYSIKLGSTTMVVLNSAEVAKEAMVTKYSSISTRKLSKALMILTSQKSLVAMSDYGDYHKMVKRYVLNSLLGASALKRNRRHRDTMIENVVNALFAEVTKDPQKAVELRQPFQAEVFSLALKQAVGKNVESIYVEELGVTMSKQEMFNVLVIDPMTGAIDVDWRDFFPYLSWVPNKGLEAKINSIATRKRAVTKALIMERKKQITKGEEVSCYLDFLLSEESTLTEEQLITLVWESIIESSDTTMITTEWAMYELAKNPECQERLLQEIQEVCGSNRITEDKFQQLPYLNAVFHETLRFHPPVSIIPPRYVHENTEIAGYTVPAGTDIAINLYACNMNKNDWDEPQVWKPERFLSSKYDQMDMYKTMAFGGGKRVCAGSSLAYLIACTVISRLVQEFEWRLKDGEEEDVVTVQLTTQKLHPMKAYIVPRKP